MTLTDEEIWKLAKSTEQPYNGKPIEIRFSIERLNDFARAIIAAHDAELRKQEPVAWILDATAGDMAGMVSMEKCSEGDTPLYAAPMPEPTVSQQEAMSKARLFERGFVYVRDNQTHVPTITLHFPIDDWDSRDAVASLFERPEGEKK